MRVLPNKQSQSGQILLIVLLILAISLTISLSIVSRTSTDVNVSQGSEEAARAFSAAEAGIEEALLTANPDSGVVNFTDTGVTYQASTQSLGAGTEFSFPGEYSKNTIMTLWLANYNQTNETYTKSFDESSIRVVWGNSPLVGTVPALEVTFYYKDTSDATNPYKIARFALDPIARATDNPNCSGVNCFCQLGVPAYCTGVSNFKNDSTDIVDGKTFKYGATLNIANYRGVAAKTLLFARLRLLYSEQDQILGANKVTAGSTLFPAQGIVITSVGQSGDSTRKVQVKRLNPVPPSFLDFLIYSGSSLVHQ